MSDEMKVSHTDDGGEYVIEARAARPIGVILAELSGLASGAATLAGASEEAQHRDGPPFAEHAGRLALELRARLVLGPEKQAEHSAE